jgi:hypothetical protein
VTVYAPRKSFGVETRLRGLGQAPQRHAAWLQEAHNALGVVWSGRSEYQKAAEHLQKAEAAYDACTLRSSNPEGEAPVASAKHYLQTCFYLAQVKPHVCFASADGGLWDMRSAFFAFFVERVRGVSVVMIAGLALRIVDSR